jgi:hypothetical protein
MHDGLKSSFIKRSDKRHNLRISVPEFDQIMDRLSAMRVFAEVVSAGGFSAAAERLEMCRSMVTRHVAELEQWLGRACYSAPRAR